MEIQKIKSDSDPLGTRIKEQYENRTRYMLPRRTYTIIRLDQKCGHTYTRGLNKPFDKGYSEDIDNAIIAMLPEIQGAVFAYTQSDEISILLTDFSLPTTSAWFDGNLQKIVSVSASILTAEFNKLRLIRHFNCQRESQWGRRKEGFQGLSSLPAYSDKCLYECVPVDIQQFPIACFDSRAFTIPDRIEVMNYFIWRNQDCSRNSVSAVAQSKFSHKELHGKSTPEMHEMLHGVGVNWATDYSAGDKNGRLITKESYLTDIKLDTITPVTDNGIRVGISAGGSGALRTRWVSKGSWKFTEDREKLLTMIPKYE